MGKALTTRERVYVQQRASGMNQSDALRATGFKGKRPDVAASKLEAKPHVKAAVEAATQKIVDELKVTHEMWMREVWSIAKVKIAAGEVKPSDKTKALELAGRAIGAFKDTAGEREKVGPGLTIVIQQSVNAAPGAAPVQAAVAVGLMPGPQR